jgi:hypothetical protein
MEFFRKQSQQMQDVADSIERRLSLNKQVSEEKVPELLKRKTSLQETLVVDLGGIQKIREVKNKEWKRAQQLQAGTTDSGVAFEIRSPAPPTDKDAQKMEEFRSSSFKELYELEVPYESRPRRREATRMLMEEETKQ